MLFWFEVSNVIHIASMNSNLFLLFGSHFGLNCRTYRTEDSPNLQMLDLPGHSLGCRRLTLPPKKLKS